MKKKIVLAVVVAAVVLAAAFALHRPQAGTQPTPEPTRQAETNDAVPAEPTPQPAATAEPQSTAATVPQQTTAPKPTQKPATKKTPVLNAILPGNDYEFDSNPGTGEGTSLRV